MSRDNQRPGDSDWARQADQAWKSGDIERAIACCRGGIHERPEDAQLWFNLGVALQRTGRLPESEDCYHRVLELDPDHWPARLNLGATLSAQDRYAEAAEVFRDCAGRAPERGLPWNNLGNALRALGRIEQSIAAYRRAVALEPKYAEAHKNLGHALLLAGEFEEGWKEYEWRWAAGDFTSPRRNFAQPLWDGTDLGGRTLLIHAEQGLGDAIQFARYLPMAAGRGGRVVFECDERLIPVMNFAGVELVAAGKVLPSFDVQAPLMSMGRIFGTTLATIPAEAPYLSGPREELEFWRKRVGDAEGKMKVGLAWAGKMSDSRLRFRACPAETLEALAGVERVRFYSLQREIDGALARPAPAALRLVDWTSELSDFGRTAGLIANLDLVISVDTAVAHLAGAMGRRVWTMLSAKPDFRWLLAREDSPWYPTMRLFRQEALGEWRGVVERVRQALSEAIADD